MIVLEGSPRLPEGAEVQVVHLDSSDAQVGQALDKLAGKAIGLPADLAQRHDR